MATCKIYVKNNYLFVECDKPKYIASGFAKNVFVKPVDATTFSISGLEVKSCETLVIKLSDMVDEDGTPYTLSTFTEFYTKYTGNFSSPSGGSEGVLKLTETEILDLPTPEDGDEVFNTTRGIKMYYDPFFGWSPVGTIPPYWGWEYHDECTGNNGSMFTITADSFVLAPNDNRKACLLLDGTAIKHLTPPFILFSENKRTYINSYSIFGSYKGSFHGYFQDPDSIASSMLTEGVYFLVDPLNILGYGANISTVVKSYLGEVVTPTTVPASTIGVFTKLEIRCDDSTSTATFLINGVVVASDSTYYPLNENIYFAGESVFDVGGAYNFALSHTTIKEKFGTPR